MGLVIMHKWPVQDAKVHFSEMLRACLTQGAQIITLHGKKTAVLVPSGNACNKSNAA